MRAAGDGAQGLTATRLAMVVAVHDMPGEEKRKKKEKAAAKRARSAAAQGKGRGQVQVYVQAAKCRSSSRSMSRKQEQEQERERESGVCCATVEYRYRCLPSSLAAVCALPPSLGPSTVGHRFA